MNDIDNIERHELWKHVYLICYSNCMLSLNAWNDCIKNIIEKLKVYTTYYATKYFRNYNNKSYFIYYWMLKKGKFLIAVNLYCLIDINLNSVLDIYLYW